MRLKDGREMGVEEQRILWMPDSIALDMLFKNLSVPCLEAAVSRLDALTPLAQTHIVYMS
jgi:hypothetical protein